MPDFNLGIDDWLFAFTPRCDVDGMQGVFAESFAGYDLTQIIVFIASFEQQPIRVGLGLGPCGRIPKGHTCVWGQSHVFGCAVIVQQCFDLAADLNGPAWVIEKIRYITKIDPLAGGNVIQRQCVFAVRDINFAMIVAGFNDDAIVCVCGQHIVVTLCPSGHLRAFFDVQGFTHNVDGAVGLNDLIAQGNRTGLRSVG